MDYEDSLIVKTAWYYYIENMTQQKISEKLGISRMKVIKLLEKARQTGVIQFKISPERSQQLMLEQKLTTQWNLKDVFVVPTPPNGSNLNETIAQAAADNAANDARVIAETEIAQKNNELAIKKAELQKASERVCDKRIKTKKIVNDK